MRYLLKTFLIISVVGCGRGTVVITQSCTTKQLDNGVEITCPNEKPIFVYNGVNGQDAIQPTMIKFCSNYESSYPTTFPEYGICIDNILYAVYWDNKNSWLTEVTPGYYSSTSTSAPCNFTVKDNCVIE